MGCQGLEEREAGTKTADSILMSKIEYHSESREWYIASATIISVATICYLIIAVHVLPDQSQIFPLLSKTINVSFLLLGLSGVFLGFQGYRFREGKAFLLRMDGDRAIVELEKRLLATELDVRGIECVDVSSLGLWRPIGRLSLNSGEIEIKEIWFSAYYYRTQIALRGDFPQEIIDDFTSSLI